MSDSASVSVRRPGIVRITHWLTTVCFFALLWSGVEILISHPRFYWGETGNVRTPALFKLPIPSSRSTVPTGYGYVMPDQNGWSRYLHFEAAWAAVLTGLTYFAYGFFSGYFQRNLRPERGQLSWLSFSAELARHLRFERSPAHSYNLLQRLTYLGVIFGLFPLVIWTGLAMSPAIGAVAPWAVTLLGGRQSARTIHFFVSIFLTLFFLTHVAMVSFSGFGQRMRSMITGRIAAIKEPV